MKEIQEFIEALGFPVFICVILMYVLWIKNMQNISKNTQDISKHNESLAVSENGVHGINIGTGTFTPTLFGEVQNGNIGYEIQRCIYFKINKHIWCDIHLKITNYNNIT